MTQVAEPQATPAGKFPDTDLSSAQIEDLLIRARVQMLLNKNAAFFGQLACNLRFIDATKWCPTAATDGRNFYYNRNFVAALHARDPAQLVFLIGHEVLHCVYNHMGRRGERDPQLWNIANDYRVNGDLINANIGKKIDLVDILHDWKYGDSTSEEIYDQLFEEAEREGRVRYYGELLDEHLDPSDIEGDGTGNNDGTNGPVKYTQDELKDVNDEFQNKVEQAARASGAGNLPAGVRRLLDSLLNPQLDWRELLAMQIHSVLKNDYTYNRFSRKGLENNIYIPGMDNDQTIDIALAIDLSGSICNEMSRDFLSEVKGIMDQYQDFKIHLFCFDTEVHNPQVFTSQNMEEFMEYDLVGGGGTDFECCWNYMKDEGIQPQRFVMFTDGYPWNSWGDEHYCETLFIVHGGRHGDTPVAPFGITVPYTREAA